MCVFHIFFQIGQDISIINVITKLNEDWTIDVTTSVLKRVHSGHTGKTAPSLGGNVFQRNEAIFELGPKIVRANVPSKFTEDWTKKNEISRSKTQRFSTNLNHFLTQTICIQNKMKMSHLSGTNVLTKFHEDWIINVASNPKYIIRTNVLTKFYEAVLTRRNSPNPGGHVFSTDRNFTINVAIRVKNAPPPCGNVFQPTETIFELHQTINVASTALTSHVRKNAPPPGGHVIGTYFLTKFHEDLTKNLASRVLTMFHYSHIKKNAPPNCHVFQPTETIPFLNSSDRTINVVSRVLKRNKSAKLSQDTPI
ncbi:hypothetical protein DPMN_000790 [Dreissena polymorpha]|uniref:Uncharacterized protein n=1 Tax=Dreissena polymorpha TaxID=45954 RepID=A0A9D4MG22_DREPO|nr:hypothetical protein DPMN_000790 [Dreissena polymorpha]